MKTDKGCIFCKIIAGEIPAVKIWEDKEFMAMLDIHPASIHGGHVLIMPKEHFELITDVPDNVLKDMGIAIKKISGALLKYGEGLNVVQNNKKVAGQYVPHVHFHLIPRFENDGVRIEKWEVNNYNRGEMEKVASKIKKLMK